MGEIIGQFSEVIFIVSFLILVYMVLKRETISDSLNMQVKPYLYMLSGIFIVIVIITMVFNNSKDKYSHISAGYNKMRPNTSAVQQKEKPHRFFDIDFDSLFPWN